MDETEEYYAAVAEAIGGADAGGADDNHETGQEVEAGAPAVEPEGAETPAGEGGGADTDTGAEEPAGGDGGQTASVAEDAGTEPAPPDGDDAGFMAGLSDRARARFEKLTGELRETREAADGFTRLRGMLNEHIDTPKTFVTLLDFSKALKAGDWQAAQRIYQAVGNELAVRSGQALPVVDPLAEFPDLQAQVGDYGLSQQQALEVALARRMQQQQRAQAERMAQEHQQQAVFAQRATQARDQVAGVLQQLEQTDPDFRVKMQQIAQQAEAIEAQYAPEQWAGVVKLMYAGVRLQPAVRKPAAPQPLRPAVTPGKVESKPASAYEAVLAAFR